MVGAGPAGSAAAEEVVVYVAELREAAAGGAKAGAAITELIRAAVARDHGVALGHIALLATRTVPKVCKRMCVCVCMCGGDCDGDGGAIC